MLNLSNILHMLSLCCCLVNGVIIHFWVRFDLIVHPKARYGVIVHPSVRYVAIVHPRVYDVIVYSSAMGEV